ncbi:MAG: hypothetical protein FWG22_00625 [Prolixibacteraceae bacterium]|nr:hypothetical protein [Prolixibacteraceae bacterium]
MQNFFTITDIRQNESEIQASVALNCAHEIFKGHFPGFPVVPGVCLLEIAKNITKSTFNRSFVYSSVDDCKFVSLINPEETPQIDFCLTFDAESGKIQCVVSSEQQTKAKIKAHLKTE